MNKAVRFTVGAFWSFSILAPIYFQYKGIKRAAYFYLCLDTAEESHTQLRKPKNESSLLEKLLS